MCHSRMRIHFALSKALAPQLNPSQSMVCRSLRGEQLLVNEMFMIVSEQWNTICNCSCQETMDIAWNVATGYCISIMKIQILYEICYGPIPLILQQMGLIPFVIAISGLSIIHTQSLKNDSRAVLVLTLGSFQEIC